MEPTNWRAPSPMPCWLPPPRSCPRKPLEPQLLAGVSLRCLVSPPHSLGLPRLWVHPRSWHWRDHARFLRLLPRFHLVVGNQLIWCMPLVKK